MQTLRTALGAMAVLGVLATTAGAQEVNSVWRQHSPLVTPTFDRDNAGNTNLCGAPVVAVDLTRFSWGSDVPIMPDSGTSENPDYVYSNLTSHMAVKATCIYEDKYKPEKTMTIPPDFDRCTVKDGQFLCFRR